MWTLLYDVFIWMNKSHWTILAKVLLTGKGWPFSFFFLWDSRIWLLRALASAPSEFTEVAKFHPVPHDLLCGSGETSSICLKMLLASRCLQRLLCFVTNSTRWWRQHPEVSLCSGVFVAGWLQAPGLTRPLGNDGEWERSLEIHSVNLVRVPLGEQSMWPLTGEWKQPAPSLQVTF